MLPITCHEVQNQYLPCVNFLLLATRRAKFVDNAGLRRLLPRGHTRRPPCYPSSATNFKTHTCPLYCHEVQNQYLPCVNFLLLATRRAKFVANAGLRRLLPRGHTRRPSCYPSPVVNSKTHACPLCIFHVSRSPKPIFAMCEPFALGSSPCKIC